MGKPRRRGGKPYNPATDAHDRRSRDLLRNARTAPVVIDCPFDQKPIVVERSTRNDPLADMMAKKQIDQCDYTAGRHWQAAYENAELGGARAIDPTKEAVDGGRMPEALSAIQMRGMQDMRAAREALGPEGAALVMDILGTGWSIKQAALARGRTAERDRLYIGARFRECLNTLAIRFGYSNERS